MTETTKTEKPKTVRALRMNSLRADGQENTDRVELVVRDPFTGVEIREDDGTPAVVIVLRPLAPGVHDAIIVKHTSLKRVGQTLSEYIDQTAVSNEILCTVIEGWTGLVGCDDRPLLCTDAVKIKIDERLKMQVTRKLFGAEAVEVGAETFR